MDEDKSRSELSDHRLTGAAIEAQIRNRAYELYLARNGGPGDALQDWLQAEAEIAWKIAH